MTGADQPVFVGLPTSGRTFTAHRRVRWGDVDAAGHLRLDAVARYLQDVANDDTRDAGLDPTEPWVVRRTSLRLDRAPVNGESLALTTWSGGHGRRWAERRTTILGDSGGRIEAAALWVRIDRDTGRPAKLDADFHAIYDEAAGGRTVNSKLLLPEAPVDLGEMERWKFPLRSTDLDALGHVNNANTWIPAVEALARHRVDAGRVTGADIEYPGAIEAGDDVEIVLRATTLGFDLWALVRGDTRAVLRLHLTAT